MFSPITKKTPAGSVATKRTGTPGQQKTGLKQTMSMPTLNTTSDALKFFLSSPAKENNKEKEKAPTFKPSLTEEGVEIERLQAEVKVLTAKLAVTEDLEKQVTSL